MLKYDVFNDYGKPVSRTGMTREGATLDDTLLVDPNHNVRTAMCHVLE